MKKQFTNPTPIKPEKEKIEKLIPTENTGMVHLGNKINEIIEFLNTHYSKGIVFVQNVIKKILVILNGK